MASSSPRTSTLSSPDNPEAIRRSFEGYRMAIARMNEAELRAELTRINSALEESTRSTLVATIQAPLTAYTSSIDQLVLRSTAREPRPSPRERGEARSQRSASQQPSPLDLLFGSSRGRRLAGKLVAAGARQVNGQRRR